jgi:hypothetical protein
LALASSNRKKAEGLLSSANTTNYAWAANPQPDSTDDDPESKEHIEFWDEDETETLNSYKGKVRVIRR